MKVKTIEQVDLPVFYVDANSERGIALARQIEINMTRPQSEFYSAERLSEEMEKLAQRIEAARKTQICVSN